MLIKTCVTTASLRCLMF